MMLNSAVGFRTLLIFAWLTVVYGSGCASAGGVLTPRIEAALTDGWKFTRDEVADGQNPSLDDSKWPSISLPHTWNVQDGSDGGTYYRGPGWYRRTVRVEPSMVEKSFFLRFGAASTVADVYINRRPVGSHAGGFGAFCFDVTELLHPGDNLLAVRVSNAKNGDVPPLAGDFTIFGGLYRDVVLLALEPLSISPTDDASSGVYLKQGRVDPKIAEIEVVTKLRNGSDHAQSATVVCTIYDAADKPIHELRVVQTVNARGLADAVGAFTLPDPHLWNGLSDPYLYHVVIEVRDGERVVDRVTEPLGLRSFKVDPNLGFFLNGKPYSLHGVDRHQEVGGKGWAATPADVETDYGFIRELGCTAVRLAHYQHPSYEYAMCDRAGIVVWAELALVNAIGKSDAFSECARGQLRELIKQNYNHPSILFWSMYNELSFSRTASPDGWKLVAELNALTHELDPSRITVGASHLTGDHPLNWVTDIVAFNRYWGWYNGSIALWPTELDKLHDANPGKSIGMSEYGAGASALHHEVPPKQAKPAAVWHPEEWQAAVHEASWNAMKDRPWIWGTFIWAMFDFASDGRNEGDQPGRNDKGLVTNDRKIRKDAFYWYKANWSAEPTVYLTSRRFDPRPIGPTEVKVYSNCDEVELFFEGKSLGKKAGPGRAFVWTNAELSRGPNNVRAVGTKDGKTFTDELTWIASTDATTRPVRVTTTKSER